MRLADVKRAARATGSSYAVAAVDFLLRQLHRPLRGTFHKQAVEFEQLLASIPLKADDAVQNVQNKELLTNGKSLTLVSRFINLWIDWCFDNKIDDTDLSQYK